VRRTLVTLALLVLAVGVATGAAYLTDDRAGYAIKHGLVLSQWLRIMMGFAAFWRAFWWTILPWIAWGSLALSRPICDFWGERETEQLKG
jgi:hypothetical protein